MRVLFLDCDGVINNFDDMCVVRIDGGCFTADRRKVGRVQTIIKDTDAKVVLCSSWRNMRGGREYVNDYLQIPVHDVTPGPFAGKIRGHDVQAWMDANPGVENYVILEDETDFLPHQLPHLVICDPEIGLTDTMAYRATNILNTGPRYTIERNDNPIMKKGFDL